ncbi:hypothetical protein EQV77_10115 [Halobacillus fulvus]|nr:hypothetical protein EQV77_10115 [Halobacillus fulvus]
MRIAFVLILSVFALIGCSNSSASNLYSFDASDLREETSDAVYQPELPSKLPFEAESSTFTPGPLSQEDTVFTFDFAGKDEVYLELFTVKGGDITYNDVETETVEIGDIEGEYSKDPSGKLQRLVWTKGDITYELKLFQGKETTIIKEDLVATAKSFE